MSNNHFKETLNFQFQDKGHQNQPQQSLFKPYSQVKNKNDRYKKDHSFVALNQSGFSYNSSNYNSQMPLRQNQSSILQSDSSMVLFDESVLPTIQEEVPGEQIPAFAQALSFNCKEQMMQSQQIQAHNNLLLASSRLQNIDKSIKLSTGKSTKIAVKTKNRKSFMSKLMNKSSKGIATSRIYEGGDDRQEDRHAEKMDSRENQKIKKKSGFHMGKQTSQHQLIKQQSGPNSILNSQEFDDIILDKDPESLNPYINSKKPSENRQQESDKGKKDNQFKEVKLGTGEQLDEIENEDRALSMRVKNTRPDRNTSTSQKPPNYKRHHSILMPQRQNFQGMINDIQRDQGCNITEKSVSIHSNLIWKHQQNFLSKTIQRSEMDTTSNQQRFLLHNPNNQSRQGISSHHPTTFNYDAFNQNLERQYAEQMVVDDESQNTMNQPQGLQRKSIIGTRRKLAKKKADFFTQQRARNLDFNVYQSIVHDSGVEHNKSRRIGRFLRGETNRAFDDFQNVEIRNPKVKPEQALFNVINTNTLGRKSGRQEVPLILKEQSNKLIRNKTILSSFLQKNGVKKFKEDMEEKFTPVKFKGLKRQLSMSKQDHIIEQNMQNSDDEVRAFDDMEVEPELLKETKQDEIGFLVIYPDSMMRGVWDISLFLFIVYQSISLPTRISFELPFSEFLFYLEIVIDVMFIMDIFLNFNTGIYQKNKLIMNRATISKDYLQWWFWIDLVSSLPMTWILAWSQGMTIREVENDDFLGSQEQKGGAANSNMADLPGLLKLLKVSKLLKMLKLLRVAKLKKLLLKFEEYIVTDSMDLMVTFFNITVKIVFIAHYMGCFFYYRGLDELRNKNQGWLIAEDMVDSPIGYAYITSIYWAFTTMSAVGYGDITPITKDEQLYTMIAMVVSCGIFAYTINSISNIVSRFNKNSSVYREKMMYVNQFLKNKDMPSDTRMKIRRYLDYVFQQKKEIKIEEADVYKILNESLRDQLQLIIKGRILNKLVFMESFGLDFLSELTMKIEQTSYISDDFIFMEKDKAECMYYIISGQVAMIHKQSTTFIKDLGIQEYFGEYGLLKDEPRCLTAKCRDFTEVYVITKKDFEDVSENCIEAIRSIRKIKDGLEKGNLSHLKLKCYICKKNDHMALRCPKYPKWRGNLMKMYLQLSEDKNNVAQSLDQINNGEKQVNLQQASEQEEEKKNYFIYAEESHENLQPVSDESDETLKIKSNLIRYNIKDFEPLEGSMVFQIFEFPKYALRNGYGDQMSPPVKGMMSNNSYRSPPKRQFSTEKLFELYDKGTHSRDSANQISPDFPSIRNQHLNSSGNRGISSNSNHDNSLLLGSFGEGSIKPQISQGDSPFKGQGKQAYMTSAFKLPKILEDQNDSQDDSQDGNEFSREVIDKISNISEKVKIPTQKKLIDQILNDSSAIPSKTSSNNNTSSLQMSASLKSSKSSLTSVSKKSSCKVQVDIDGMQDVRELTPNQKNEYKLEYQKMTEIINLSNRQQDNDSENLRIPKNEIVRLNTQKNNEALGTKKINIINNQDILTERNKKTQIQKALQIVKTTPAGLKIQKEPTSQSRNSKSKGSYISVTNNNKKRGRKGGKKRIAHSNGKRRDSIASRLEQSFDAYNLCLTQTGLQTKKLNSNTSKSKRKNSNDDYKSKNRSRFYSESQNDKLRIINKQGDDIKSKDQQQNQIFTNSINLSKKFSVIEEEKNNQERDEKYLEETPGHLNRYLRSQEPKRYEGFRCSEIVNSSLGDIKSSINNRHHRDLSQDKARMKLMKNKNIMQNRPIIDSNLFQLKQQMGNTHQFSSNLIKEINGLLSPTSNLTISSLNQM